MSNIQKVHQIPRLKSFLSYLAVAFAQSIEARGRLKYEDVVVALLTGMLQLHPNDEQFYCLLRCDLY